MSFSGRLLLLQYESAPTTYTTIAGFRANTFTINEQSVDITTKDDAGIRQLLNGNILRAISASGEGVFPDNTSVEALRVAAMAGTHLNYRLVVPGDSTSGGHFQGAFRITSLEYSGAHDGEAVYSISLESDGAITWTAAT
jgi:TP901-1 family phage major tail protein